MEIFAHSGGNDGVESLGKQGGWDSSDFGVCVVLSSSRVDVVSPRRSIFFLAEQEAVHRGEEVSSQKPGFNIGVSRWALVLDLVNWSSVTIDNLAQVFFAQVFFIDEEIIFIGDRDVGERADNKDQKVNDEVRKNEINRLRSTNNGANGNKHAEEIANGSVHGGKTAMYFENYVVSESCLVHKTFTLFIN